MRHFGMFRVASSILKFFKNNFLEKGRQWKIKNNRDASIGSNFASPWLQPELRCVMTFFNGTTLPSFPLPPLKLVRLKQWITFKIHFYFFSEQTVHFFMGILESVRKERKRLAQQSQRPSLKFALMLCEGFCFNLLSCFVLKWSEK